MPGGFLHLRQSALQPFVRAFREVRELPQGLKGPEPASQASQVSLHQPHAPPATSCRTASSRLRAAPGWPAHAR